MNRDGFSRTFGVRADSVVPTPVFVGAIVTGRRKAISASTAPSKSGKYHSRRNVHRSLVTGTFIVS